MSELVKKPRATPKKRPRHVTTQWTCNHQEKHSEITAFVEINGQWQVVAETSHAPGIDGKANAEFIALAVNERPRYLKILGDLIGALELCLESKGLSWEAEQEAELVLKRARQAI